MRYLEKNLSKGNVIDLIGAFFQQLGYIKDNEFITDIEIDQWFDEKDVFRVKIKIEKELEVRLIEHT